jgi:hypothetical protein
MLLLLVSLISFCIPILIFAMVLLIFSCILSVPTRSNSEKDLESLPLYTETECKSADFVLINVAGETEKPPSYSKAVEVTQQSNDLSKINIYD